MDHNLRKRTNNQKNESTTSPRAGSHHKAHDSTYWWPGFLAEICLAYIFWSTFVEFPATVWFYPLVKMGITGKEIIVFVYMSPILLSSHKIRNFILNHQALAYVITLTGMLAYLAVDVDVRAGILALGMIWSLTTFFGTWWSNPSRRRRSVYALLLGLLILVSLRFWFSTINPIFYIGEVNIAVFVMGLIACFVLSKDPLIRHVSNSNESAKNQNKRVPTSSWMLSIQCGFGFGTLLFLTHFLMSCHGVLARNLDLHPFPYGIGSILAMVIGFLLVDAPFTTSWLYFMMMLIAAPLTIYLPKQIGIFFGYFLIVYVASVWQVAVENLVQHTIPQRSLPIAGFVYLLEILASVWTVAYNFVPILGPEMRERTKEVLIVCFALLGLITLTRRGSSNVKTRRAQSGVSSSKVNSQFLIALFLVILLCFVPAIVTRRINYQNYDGYGITKNEIRAIIWATHFGYDNLGWPSYNQMLREIKATEANIIGLLETDVMRTYTGNRDFVEWLEEKLHMYSDYGPATLNNTWGCALLSAFPILYAARHNLPSPNGEIACLIDAIVDVHGRNVGVIVVHFGNTPDYLDRKLQAEENHKLVLAHGNRPVIWLGYLTDRTGSDNYNKLIQAGLSDSAPEHLERYCEYIFYKGLKQKSFQKIDTGDVSDTEIQMSVFELPQRN
jgi:endonuclease/exonuclease/phosphatase family metal-dependent hydrolase